MPACGGNSSSVAGGTGYALLTQEKATSRRVQESPTGGVAFIDPSPRNLSPIALVSPKVVEQEQVIAKLQEEKDGFLLRLADLELSYITRKTPIIDGLAGLEVSMANALHVLEELRNPQGALHYPGPDSFRWVEGTACSLACSGVILVNMLITVLETTQPQHAAEFWWLDQIFLVCYVGELAAKAILHRGNLLLGRPIVVWWNWLDTGIVVSGVLDQWLMPSLKACGILDAGHGTKLGFLRVLRLLRLFRIMRMLKVLKVFLKADLSWTEGHTFQTFIIGVICVNSVIMSCELDYPWSGWYWSEQIMLVIYFFELAVRLKRWGWLFFCHPDDWKMNCLDFVIVSGGVAEQWMIPTFAIVKFLITGNKLGHITGAFGDVMKLLRMMRLLRVLRLIRLVRNIKPLYRLMFGLMAALGGVQWVLLLAMIMLYAASILFTTMVGHGLIYGGHPTEDAKELFGSVLQSMFVLFKLMSGDQGVVDPLLSQLCVKVLFLFFIILANWIMLAILTAVVSDNMISTTQTHIIEDHAKDDVLAKGRSNRRLVNLFQEFDKGGENLDEPEFVALMRDPDRCHELCDASGLRPPELLDLYLFLSMDIADGTRTVNYKNFTEQLLNEGNSVSERSIFRLERRVENIEGMIAHKFDSVGELLERLVQIKLKNITHPDADACREKVRELRGKDKPRQKETHDVGEESFIRRSTFFNLYPDH